MRYRSISVFRLGGWSPQLPTGFLVSRGTPDPAPCIRLRLRGSHSLWLSFPAHSASLMHLIAVHNPGLVSHPGLGLLPRSLAATRGISVDSFSSGYLDVSVHRVPFLIEDDSTTAAGFPHSEICGSKVTCTSPQLIAAYRVLLRLIWPRHPPYALTYLTNFFMHHVVHKDFVMKQEFKVR